MNAFSPRSIGAALDDAIRVYRRNFKMLALMAACTVFPVALVTGLAQDFYYRDYFGFMADAFSPTAASAAPEMPVTMAIASLVIYAAAGLTFFLRAYFDAAVLAAAPQLATGVRVTFRDVWRGGIKRYGWYLIAQLLVGMITGFATFASFLVLGLGGLIVGVFVTFTGLLTVVENIDPVRAVQRSWGLVKGSFWRVAGYLILMTLLATAFQGAIASPAALGQLVPALRSGDAITQLLDVPIWWRVAEGLSFGVAAALTAPFSVLALFHLYVDMRSRKEGMDLVVEAREISRAA